LISNSHLNQITSEQPETLRELWMVTTAEAAISRAWLFRLGRLDAVGRIAHFLSEMNFRLEAAGLSDGLRFALPLTQSDIAEICGLTAVHVNRVIRSLRETRLCTFRSSVVQISDRAELETIGQFDSDYLRAGRFTGSFEETDALPSLAYHSLPLKFDYVR
jgi:CRP-like cAMP-binding protein